MHYVCNREIEGVFSNLKASSKPLTLVLSPGRGKTSLKLIGIELISLLFFSLNHFINRKLLCFYFLQYIMEQALPSPEGEG